MADIDKEGGMNELHVFRDDCEWVIAYSEEDAYTVARVATGERVSPKDYEPGQRWRKLDPDATTKMWCDASGNVCEIGEGTLTELTNREWIARKGRRYLGSTEG